MEERHDLAKSRCVSPALRRNGSIPMTHPYLSGHDSEPNPMPLASAYRAVCPLVALLLVVWWIAGVVL